MTKLFVGNLPVSATDASVGALFAEFGKVEHVERIIDRETGQPRGFGYVDMPAEDAARALENINGQEFEGRKLKVSEAEERPSQGDKKRRRPQRH
jgi:RNA recognition motif-containing protein